MEKDEKYFDDTDDSEIDFSDAPEMSDSELEKFVSVWKIYEMILSKENLSFCEEKFDTNIGAAIDKIVYYFSDEKATILFDKPLDEVELEMQQYLANVTDRSEIKPNCILIDYLEGIISQENIEFCKKYAGENYIFGMNRIIYAYRKEWQQKQEFDKAA